MSKATEQTTTGGAVSPVGSLPSRRAILAGGASVLAVVAAGGAAMAATGPNPDAELHAACAELARVMDAEAAGNARRGVPDAEMNAIIDSVYAGIDRLHGIPARTGEGRRVKAAISGRVLRDYMKDQGERAQPELMLALAALGDVAGGIVA